MGSYLKDLDAVRLIEGQTVVQAFKVMRQDIERLKMECGADHRQRPAAAPR